jgi:hypothetical protein
MMVDSVVWGGLTDTETLTVAESPSLVGPLLISLEPIWVHFPHESLRKLIVCEELLAY